MSVSGAVAIAAMDASDWDEVRRIYAEGIATGNATMETAPPEREAWDRAHRSDCRHTLHMGLGSRHAWQTAAAKHYARGGGQKASS